MVLFKFQSSLIVLSRIEKGKPPRNLGAFTRDAELLWHMKRHLMTGECYCIVFEILDLEIYLFLGCMN
jgi:hypothetical protein